MVVTKAADGRVHFHSQFKGTVHHSGKSREQEGEPSGHITSAVRKQREMDAGAELTFFSLFSPGL